MKKVIAMFLLIAVMVPAAAYATTPVLIGHGYYDDFSIVPFIFSNTTVTRDTEATKKGDSEQRWYVTIGENSTVSSTNVLGMRPRLKATGVEAAGYYTVNKRVTGLSHSYYANTVTKDTSVFLRLKKDSSSTTTMELDAAGKFCP